MKSRYRFAAITATLLISITWSAAFAEGSRQAAEIAIPERAQSSYDNWGYAPAVRVGNTIYVSGVVSLLEGEGTYEERYARGFETALKWIEEVLNEAGASLDDVIDITSFHTDLQRQLQTAIKVRMEHMAPPHPTWTAVGTTALATPDGVTEIKVIAHVEN
jgi:enamine deaminase RidA (YjgF/YER057c/UK114 family)